MDGDVLRDWISEGNHIAPGSVDVEQISGEGMCCVSQVVSCVFFVEI